MVNCRHGTALLVRKIGTKALMRPAALAFALAGSMADAAPMTLRCNPHADVDATAASALCAAFADALATSKRANLDGVTMQLDVNTLRPTAINVTLNLTGPNGAAHTINRALSANDTTITPAMQVTFLQKLMSAIPSDF